MMVFPVLNALCKTAADLGINLEISDEACCYIAKKSFDFSYGARPIKRCISRLIETPLSEKILTNEIKKGDTVSVFLENNSIQLCSKSLLLTKL